MFSLFQYVCPVMPPFTPGLNWETSIAERSLQKVGPLHGHRYGQRSETD